jgi:hypothetical protein
MAYYYWGFETIEFHEVRMSTSTHSPHPRGSGYLCLAPPSKSMRHGSPYPAWLSSSLFHAMSLTRLNVPSSMWKHHRGSFKCIETHSVEWLRVKASLDVRDEVWEYGCIAPRILRTWSYMEVISFSPGRFAAWERATGTHWVLRCPCYECMEVYLHSI